MDPIQQTNRWQGWTLALIVGAGMGACGDESILVRDFSKTIRLESGAKGPEVVGLLLKAELDANTAIVLQVGCDGVVHQHMLVPPNEVFERRLDWYASCAEVSFQLGAAAPKSMRLRYSFQTL